MKLPVGNERKALHAYLTDQAHQAWSTFAEENGVSITGLLEALGITLSEELDGAPPDKIRQPWIRAGRKVDALRRRRG